MAPFLEADQAVAGVGKAVDEIGGVFRGEGTFGRLSFDNQGGISTGVFVPKGAGTAAPPGPVGAYAEGTFTPLYKDYPGGPTPLGPVRLLPDAEYALARRLADNANAAIKRGPNAGLLGGRQIHEIQPVKFGGDPVSGFNKAYLDQPVHSAYTNWWNSLQRWVEQ